MKKLVLGLLIAMITSVAHAAPSQIAVFGGGCFWCLESELKSIEGVVDTESGYMGGEIEYPTYEVVSSGTSDHVEVVKVEFNPREVHYADLVEAFFRAHDPTQLNRQGVDVGTQYRSVIFYKDEDQRRTAEKVKERLNHSGELKQPIVTAIEQMKVFWPAESYHQDFYDKRPDIGLIRKLQKKLPWKKD